MSGHVKTYGKKWVAKRTGIGRRRSQSQRLRS